MKKLFFASLLAMSSLTLFGCQKKYVYGTFYSIKEAYENEFIDRQDLINMAYFINREVEYNTPEHTIEYVSIDDVDKSIIYAIKKNHCKRACSKATMKRINMSYYGCYHDCYAVWMSDDCYKIDPMPEGEFYLDGVMFRWARPEGRYPGGIEVWRAEPYVR